MARYENPNVKAFAAIKKIDRAKVVRRRFKRAIIAGATAIAVALAIAVPYVVSSSTINDFVDVDSSGIVQVDDTEFVDSMVEDKEVDIPWGTPPEGLIFEGDVVGYLSDECGVFNTVLPIVQSSSDDPNYYINHNIYGDADEFGTPYKDSINQRGLADDCSSIYGHNLVDGSMFGTLKNYADKDGYLWDNSAQDYYNNQKEMYGEKANKFYYTDEYGQYELDVVASGVYDGSEILKYVGNFDNVTQKENAIKLFTQESDIKSDVTLDKYSKIVILQTCEDGDSNTYKEGAKRIYVICKATQLVKYKDFDNVNENSRKSLS